MPRIKYDDKDAEDTYFNNTPMAKQNPEDLQRRLDSVVDAIDKGTMDTAGANSTSFRKKKEYATASGGPDI